MKVITIRNILKHCLRISFSLLSLFFLCLVIPHVNSQCKLQFGCIGREKYLAYVPMIGPGGEKKQSSVVNYKVIYLLSDRMVFYNSANPDSKMLEVENLTEEATKIESRIERSINYGEIILDCGPNHNKLCHIAEYPGIESTPSYKKVNDKIKTVIDVLCILVPFFENAYQLAHEKIAYICVNSVERLQKLIEFKHRLSRLIEKTQLKLSNDPHSGFNGLLRRKEAFITYYKKNTVNVVAKLHIKGVILFQNDKDEKFLRHYSLHQQRLPDNNVWIASNALSTGKIDQNWYGYLRPPPNPDCCLFFRGETETMVLCKATRDGTTIESASDVCKKKLTPFLGDVKLFVNGIKYAYAYNELANNADKLNNCKSKEYAVLDWRVHNTIKYAVEVDCRIIFQHMKHMKMTDRFTLCQQNYVDLLRSEHMLMADEDKTILNAIQKCVYDSKANKKILTEEYLVKLLADAKIYKPNKISI